MITLNVLYPNTAAAKCDMNHYLPSHIVAVEARARDRADRLHRGTRGSAAVLPARPQSSAVLRHLRFNAVESYQLAIGPVADQIRLVAAAYPREAPIIQLSDVEVAP